MGCMNSEIKYPQNYHFLFNGMDKTSENQINFQSNFVKTSKYNIVTFIPFSLLLQFQRLPNVYFLVIAILQTIPQISTLTPITAWAPLIVVIGLSMLRQGVQDYNRYKSDKQMNSQKACVKRNNNFQDLTWSQVIIGDICRVEKDQTFPADLILLRSSIPGGAAYIQTASLDGQSNLKPRSAKIQTSILCQDDKLQKLYGKFEGSQPVKELDKFSCQLFLDPQFKSPLNIAGDKQFLYRGAKLRNTQYIYGLVVYTGRATKIMLNSGSSVSKMSQIQSKVNTLLIFIFIFQCILSTICAIAYGVTENAMTSSWYITQDVSVGGSSILIFLSYLVLFNTMIPISLIVSLQIVKFVQGYFIQSDLLLYNKARKKGIKVLSSSLNQQLGQIQYVFSDKTGTLTCNKMDFKLAVIGQRVFGDIGSLFGGQNKKYQKIDQKCQGFNDLQLLKVIQGRQRYQLQNSYQIRNNQTGIVFNDYKQLAIQYVTALALTHQCVVQQKKNIKRYQGPSPDQITLVNMAKNMGFQFLKTDNMYTYAQIDGQIKKFQLLNVFEFNSDRKRMSIIIKDKGIIKMYIKGADSIIKARLGNKTFQNQILLQIDRFAKFGLRTLLIAMKTISNSDYIAFKNRINATNSQKQKFQQISKFESGLFLLGATVVEDKLQPNVPQTLRDLIRANIKVWMLTGDKLDTAKNIAASCNLIQKQFQVLQVDIPEIQYQRLSNIQKTSKLSQILKKKLFDAQQYTRSSIKKALIIQGLHLQTILIDQESRQTLASLAKLCQSVVCCRLAPQQKADLVNLVKTYLNKITLSIGDGSNDVPMIKAAHIGIGLYGEQGMGAVQASDYALPEFQGLWRLLLVHGRWNYIRIADMILYFFYKNMLFTIPQFYYAFYCAFSAQSYFDDTYISLFNIVFTSVPLIIRALLQQDVYYIYKSGGERKQKTLSKLPQQYEQKSRLKKLFPKLYYVGQQNTIFNYKKFFFWVSQAILQGLLICLITIYVLGDAAINQSGYNSDLWLTSITTYSCVIILVTFKLATHTKFWSWLMAFCLFFLSVCIYIAYMWISNIVSTNISVQGSIIQIYSTLETYLTVFFCTGILLIIDGAVIYLLYLYDFKTGKISKIRSIIDQQKIQDEPFYQQMSLQISKIPTIKN